MFSWRVDDLFCTVRVLAFLSYKRVRGKFFIPILQLEKTRQSLRNFLKGLDPGASDEPSRNPPIPTSEEGKCLISSSGKFLIYEMFSREKTSALQRRSVRSGVYCSKG